MIGATASRAVIKTLSIHTTDRDALSARLHAERLLGAIDLHPPSLPPSAILCVRRLSDPRPGTFQLDARSLRPDAAWASALLASLDAMVRRAARPAEGSVGASAEAVIFADRSDLLACLARDFLRGEVGARWWWASLLPSVGAPRAAIVPWLEAPEHVPGALHLLAERGEAAPFVEALTRTELRGIARALGDRFGVPALLAAVERAEAHVEVERVGEQAPRAQEPWAPWARDGSGAALDPRSQAFLGISLTLHRAPATARSMAFGAAVLRWIEQVAPATSESERTLKASKRLEQAPSAPAPSAQSPDASAQIEASISAGVSSPRAAEDQARLPGEPPRSAVTVVRETSTLPGASVLAPVTSPTRAETPDEQSTPGFQTTGNIVDAPRNDALSDMLPMAASVTAREALAETIASAPGFAAPAAKGASAAPLPTTLLPDPALSPEPPAPRRLGAPVSTAFGGAFFLINLAQYLELYGDFSTPLTPGITLPLWDFVALVGRALVGEALVADPLWALLATLAGRDPGEAPGGGFVPEDAWRVPPAWLRPFREAGEWSWAIQGARLSLQHPAGFTMLDVPIEGDAAEQLQREASTYGAPRLVEVAEPSEAAPIAPLDRWLSRLLPYVRARLTRALGVGVEEIGSLVCAIPARVHCTATHLDVRMSLADLPIEVRLAGLDRDPGWVPAAGRYLAFHFN